jgi:hypothetical protein
MAAENPMVAGECWERRGLVAAAILIGAVGVIGFGLSAVKVTALLAPTMADPGLAGLVPVSIDLGILAFAGLDLVHTRRGSRVWWLSWAHDGFCLATLVLNVSGERTVAGVVAHGATISLWFLGVKAATATVKAWTLVPEQRRQIPLGCWLLAPIRTWKTWRAETLARITPPTAPTEMTSGWTNQGPDSRALHQVPPAANAPAAGPADSPTAVHPVSASGQPGRAQRTTATDEQLSAIVAGVTGGREAVRAALAVQGLSAANERIAAAARAAKADRLERTDSGLKAVR